VKTKVSPSIVGLFVLGALLLAVVALMSFGGVNFFSRPQRFEVRFDESVHGLDLGSPVKLRGVRVGRVVSVQIRYDEASGQSAIAVVCELSGNVIADAQGAMLNVASRDELQKLVDRGMRARLGVAGLATGLLFVELDFLDAKQFPVTQAAAAGYPYVVIPAVRSTISEFQASLSDILTKLQKVDLVGLANNTSALIMDARRQLNALDLPQLVNESTQTVRAVRVLASDPVWQATLANLNGAITDLRSVIAGIGTQVAPTAEKINETLAQVKTAADAFNATAQTLRQFITAQQGLGADADIAVRRIAEAADAVRRLAEFLERNPAALLTGSKNAEPGPTGGRP
jgi:paraquat-inducible protein B